ncbi:MAG: D-TA family PLP-dependent enzyme [Bacteroidota bacterium]
MSEEKDWFIINDIDKLDSPVLVVYIQRVKANIQTAVNMVKDVLRLRPHIKTHKSPQATQLMIDAGITKFKCATIAETEMLGDCNAKDVLLAYQPIGPKLQRFITVIKKFPSTKYSCLVDNTEAAKEMAAAFFAEGLTVPVYLDINVGQNRTGIDPEHASALYSLCASLNGIKPVCLHAYDGHIRDSDFKIRKEKCDACFAKVEASKKQIMQNGFDEPVIVAGGSPTFSIHCNRENIECSPGTFIYWDKGYRELCPEQHFLPAALVISRVISLPAENRICVDLGHKSIAAENEITRRVYFLNAPELKAVGQSEEHLVLETIAGHHYKTGDVFYGMPIHICPTIALYERAYIIENGNVTGEWKNVARDRKITI